MWYDFSMIKGQDYKYVFSGLASFGLLPQINASLLGTQVLGPQFMVRQSMGFDGVGQVQHPQQIMSQGATVDSSNGYCLEL